MSQTSEEKKVEELEAALEKERGELSTKLSDVIQLINRIDKISEAQVLMLSYRHMIVDKLVKVRAGIYRRKSNNENFRKMRYEYYKTQHDVRLDFREINQFIASDMAIRNRQIELLESQVSYYQQCIETLDKMGFSIKNKIAIEELNSKMF